MGDVSEMMLDGVLCQECGEYIESEAPGHPRTCAACFDDGIARLAAEMIATSRARKAKGPKK